MTFYPTKDGDTNLPTASPVTSQPSRIPSAAPSARPSMYPTSPSALPSCVPSSQPSSCPSGQPSTFPTSRPSCHPSGLPTDCPSVSPSSVPSSIPSGQPTCVPSALPSGVPSSEPSSQPSVVPSGDPTGQPSGKPTSQPSTIPSSEPSGQPTSRPTAQPTCQPSVQPSGQPTDQPSSKPSGQPTSEPTAVPSGVPTAEPSGQPSGQPTLQPSSQPSTQPSGQPSGLPSGEPSSQPSGQPSGEPTSSPTESFYDHFKFDGTAFDGIPTEVNATFTFIVNDESDISIVNSRWVTFVEDELSFPFDLDFYSVYMKVSGVAYTDQEVTDADIFNCTDYTANDPIIAAVTSSGISSFSRSTCDGVGLAARSGTLCIGCDSDASIPSCSTPTNGTIILPIDPNCATGGLKIAKRAVALLFTYREETVATVPTITSMSVVADKTNLTVRAIVSSTTSGGTIYCGAYKSLSVPLFTVTRSLVKSSGYFSPVVQQSGATIVDISISNLVAATNYSVFCHIEDALANKGSLSAMLQLKKQIFTTCCRDIVFSKVTNFVRSSTTPNSDYVFTYVIPSFPKDGSILELSPVMEDANGTIATGILVSPAIGRYSDDNRNLGLSRSFVVFADSVTAVSGTYSLKLMLSGSVSGKYAAPAEEYFQLVADENLVPAPLLTAAIFADTGRSVSVCFDGATDQGRGILGDDSDLMWVCDRLFDFEGDAFTACTWLSNKCVEMVFCGEGLCSTITDRNSLNLMEPGDSITLLPGMIRGACYTELCVDDDFLQLVRSCDKCPVQVNEEDSFVVKAPLVPLLPTVFLSVSSVDGACKTDSLYVDASKSFGSGGRPWKNITWTVQANTSLSNTEALISYLNSFDSISSPIAVPHAMLSETIYTFTLRLLNFFQSTTTDESYSSVIVDASSTLLKPSVSFDSPPFQRVKVYDELTVTVNVGLPSCIANSPITYKWKVFKGLTYVPSIISSSGDPQKMVLSPYTLEAGATYSIYVTAKSSGSAKGSAIVTIFAEESSVFVDISGPSSLRIPFNQSLELDASSSAIKDQLPGISNEVFLSWTCTVSVASVDSHFEYGDSCDLLIDLLSLETVSSKDLVPIKTHLMESQDTYIFYASALSGSEVLGFDSITVEVADSSTNLLPYVSITSSFSKFVADSILQLHGVISPTSPGILTCDWSVFDSDGNTIAVVTSTPQHRQIPANSSSVSFAFSTPPNTFVTGKTYSFQLSARSVSYDDSSVLTLAALTATANGPPSSGELVISPESGLSFETIFLFQALYWIEDSSDYPISYIFRYTLRTVASSNSTTNFLALGLASQRSYLNTLLPPGFPSSNRTLVCSLLASDIFGATAEKRTSIVVSNSSSTISASTLNKSMTEAFNLGDSDAVGQGVNNAATELTVDECSSAPDCSFLNREDCYDTSHTCGSCISGYTGIAGDSNSECYIEDTKFILDVGDACSIDSDCSTFFCSAGFCYAPTKECPSTSQADVCSGNGMCVYYDKSTGYALDNCTASSTNCAPQCSCDDNFYGTACSLTFEAYSDRVQSRELMCEGLLYIARQQTHSVELVSYLASSLEHAFNPHEAGSLSSIASCLEVVRILTNMTNAGYLKNDGLQSLNGAVSPQHAISALVSKLLDYIFIVNSENSTTTALLEDTMSLVDAMVRGISRDMVGGEESLTIVSAGMRLSVGFYAMDDISNAVLQPPETITDSQYNKPLPTISLPPSGMQICSELSGVQFEYIRLYMIEWIDNPYISSIQLNQSLAAPILRFASIGSGAEYSTSDESASISNFTSDSNYNLTLYWNEEKNGTTGYVTDIASFSVDAVISPSIACTVVNTNSFSVTYSCNNLHNLCPSTSTERRRLSELVDLPRAHLPLDHPHFRYWEKETHRRLDFDYEGEGDDDAADSATYADFGSLITSIGEEFVMTFGAPGAFTLDEGLPVLVSVSFVVIMFAVGVVLFHRWDMRELYKMRYVTVGMSKSLTKSLSSTSPNKLDAFVLYSLDVDTSESSSINSESDFSGKSDSDSDDSLSDGEIGRIQSMQWSNRLIPVQEIEKHKNSWKPLALTTLRKSLWRLTSNATDSVDDEGGNGVDFNNDADEDCVKHPVGDPSSPNSYRPPSDGSTRPSSLMVRQHGRKHIHTAAELGTVTLRHQFVKCFKYIWKSCKRCFRHLYKSLKHIGTAAMRVHVPTIAEIRQTHKDKTCDDDNVTTFLERSLPPSLTLNEKNGFKRFFNAILREHDWLRCFTYSSSRFPRAIRFLVVFTNVIILFFVDSLFFAILFPNDNYCENLSGRSGGTMESCLSRSSRLKSDTSYCMWDDSTGVCELRPPPSDIIYFFIVSILVSFMSIVPATLCESVLINICARRPRFSKAESHQKHSKTESSLGQYLLNIKTSETVIDRLGEVYSYFQHCSVEDEVNSMLASVEGSLAKGNEERKLPWSTAVLDTDHLADNADAVKEFVGLDDDGNPLPLTFVQKLFFKNPRKRVEWKVKKAREEALEILDDMDLFVDGEEDLMDVLLIQKFILEQLTPFRRYALQAEFFQFDGAAPAFVNGYLWLFCWMVIILVWIFCVSWMFFWAVNNGSGTVSVWAYQIIFVLMQDICVNEVMQIFIVNILTIELLRPQLRQIYNTLNLVLREKLDPTSTIREAEVMIRIVQHMSATCRVSHMPSLRHLPSVQLLSKVNDHDVKMCRASRKSELGWFVKFLVAIPTVLAMMHESIQESILDVIIPTLWCCFLIANVFLWSLHPFFGPILMCTPYLLVILVYLHRYCWLIPRRHARRVELSNSNMRSGDKHTDATIQNMWRNMNLNLALRGNNLISRLPSDMKIYNVTIL